MAVKAIAYSYWRRIKAGGRDFNSIHANVKDDVRILAQIDVADGVITADEYKEFIGEDYPVAE